MGDCISKTCAYQLTTHTHLCMHTRMRRLSRDQLEADMGQCDRPPPFQTSVLLGVAQQLDVELQVRVRRDHAPWSGLGLGLGLGGITTPGTPG
eukprot:scaffold96894_cov60-Phaeocystis_antarctica.AAC.3